MPKLPRPLRLGGAALLGLATIALTGSLTSANAATAASPPAASSLSTLRNSLPATTNPQTGSYSASSMTVEVALAPQNQTGLNSALQAIYTEGSSQYHQFLSAGQFDATYAPTAAERASVASYLANEGLTVASASSPFLLSVTGSSAKITAAFHTRLSNYVDPRGIHYFQNSQALQVPTSIVSDIQGVVGLTNTVREQPGVVKPLTGRAAASASSASASCESPYVTKAQLFTAVNTGVNFPYGYGGGPGCAGLTPSQTNSMYDAPAASTATQGSGVNAAVFELSAYQASDIKTWAKTFYGAGYSPSLSNVNVDGGPLAPVCPAGDTCAPASQGYAGDIEVVADIENTLAIAKDSHVIVYNAPNDETGQTELNEYTVIANQDRADTISSSWGTCESSITAGLAEAENTVFEQMAMQGQSMFASSGDTGAFGCIRVNNTTAVNQSDPSSQPWVTSVGGTSFESDNPGTNPNPGPPATGTETVWNVRNLCSEQGQNPGNDNQGGYFWCGATGAGGGGSSQYWGRPFYQQGPGVNNPYVTYGNGTTNCSLAATGTPCRQVPDISANADEYTPYAEYCTGSAATPGSVCATIGSGGGGGWFGIGGTSLSSPLWAAVTADRDSYQGRRTGNINPLLYYWLRTNPSEYFTDITGQGRLQRAATNNGLFPTTPGYDEATGIGTPKFAGIITG
jgi:subtilase family serine protease